jgi:twitching motility protein PilJ
MIQKISDSARSQAEAASDLTSTMQGIQEVTTQSASGTEKTSRSIGTLSRLAQDLDTSVAGFKLPQ